MMTHRSSSDIFSFTGMWASQWTVIPLDWAREILLLRMASAMGLPVLTTVSTVFKSVSSISRYSRMAFMSPFAASTFMVWMWLR